MNKTIVSAIALLTLVACGQQTDEEAVVEQLKALGSGIDSAGMDLSVRPGEDFFAYMNGTWVAETEIPADKARYGTFDMLRDESQENVKTIIEESSTGDFAKGTDEQKVGDLYRSFMDTETRDAKGVEPLQPALDRIAAIADRDELAEYFAEASIRNLGGPFGFGQLPDLKDPTRYVIGVGQGGLGMPDREYYLKDDDKSAELRAKYVEHVEKMFDLAGLEDGAAAARTIMALETRLAEQHMTKEQSRNFAANYNLVALGDLPEVMPSFNWDGFLDVSGIASLEVDGIAFFSTDYMKSLDGIVTDTDLDAWKTYLCWNALNNTASQLTTAIDDQNFDFYSRTLRGTEEQRAMWRRAVPQLTARSARSWARFT